MILFRYFSRRFARSLFTVIAVFAVIMALLNFIEILRKYGDEGASGGLLIWLTILDLPRGLHMISPLIVIIAALSYFLGLARSSELVIARASGRSAIRTLAAPVSVTLIAGAIGVMLLNPLTAASTRAFEQITGQLEGRSAISTVANGGLWLRQGDAEQQSVIHAEHSNANGSQLVDVSIFTFDTDAGPVARYEASGAVLNDGFWSLTDVKRWPLRLSGSPEAMARTTPLETVESPLTVASIRESLSDPASISIWKLPKFVRDLREAGFSARLHEIWIQTELSQPLFNVAMVLIAACFTLRPQRGGGTARLVLFAVLWGFALFFLRSFALVLGESGQIPAVAAAWLTPFAGIGLALGYLLYQEDG